MTTSAGAAQPVDTLICNQALGHLGSVKQIQNLDSDASTEAIVARTFYYGSRDDVLRAFPWPFATKFAQLQLVQSFPTSEWQYAYRLPSDCLLVRRICSGNRNDNRQSRVSFKIGADSSGGLIYTDWQNATQSTTATPALIPDVEYTFQQYNTAFWSTDFTTALGWKVAYYMAPMLAKGDPFQLRGYCEQQFKQVVSEAKAVAANEQQDDVIPESEFIRARDGMIANPWSCQPYKNFPGGYTTL